MSTEGVERQPYTQCHNVRATCRVYRRCPNAQTPSAETHSDDTSAAMPHMKEGSEQGPSSTGNSSSDERRQMTLALSNETSSIPSNVRTSSMLPAASAASRTWVALELDLKWRELLCIWLALKLRAEKELKKLLAAQRRYGRLYAATPQTERYFAAGDKEPRDWQALPATADEIQFDTLSGMSAGLRRGGSKSGAQAHHGCRKLMSALRLVKRLNETLSQTKRDVAVANQQFHTFLQDRYFSTPGCQRCVSTILGKPVLLREVLDLRS